MWSQLQLTEILSYWMVFFRPFCNKALIYIQLILIVWKVQSILVRISSRNATSNDMNEPYSWVMLSKKLTSPKYWVSTVINLVWEILSIYKRLTRSCCYIIMYSGRYCVIICINSIYRYDVILSWFIYI